MAGGFSGKQDPERGVVADKGAAAQGGRGARELGGQAGKALQSRQGTDICREERMHERTQVAHMSQEDKSARGGLSVIQGKDTGRSRSRLQEEDMEHSKGLRTGDWQDLV